MGLKKFFKQKDLTDKESKDLLEKNGVVMKDESNYHRKKFKFQEFGKFSEQQAKNQDNTLKPIMPNLNTGYGSYENDINQDESNHGYGYDEYANNFKNESTNSDTNNYGYSNDNSYSYNSYSNNLYSNNTYSNNNTNKYSKTYERSNRRAQTNDIPPRRGKINNFSTTSSYHPSASASAATAAAATATTTATAIAGTLGRTSTVSTANPSNGYGYEPSIHSTNTSNTNGYGFDPYNDTEITSKSTNVPEPVSRTETRSTYDPYAPGEEPYAGDNNDPYGGYDAYDAYAGDDNNVDDIDNNTITDGMASINNGLQAVQLQEENKQRQETEQDFDPYGPSAEVQDEQEYNTEDMDLNAYDPVQQQSQPYDEDEFEDEELDEDEEELNRIQRQTKDVREDTVNLSRTLVDNLGQANVTATNTLGVLGNQREKIYEMENNIGTMKVQQRFVDDHVKELEHYNRSLFHIKVNNPFTRNSRRRAKDQAFLAMRQEDRANKDKLNNDLYQSQRAIMDQLKNDNVKSELQQKYDYDRRVKEASKYLTKDHDEEDERMEAEIAANVEHAQKLAANLKNKAQLMNSEIQQQNQDLRQVSENVDHMDDKIVMTTRRIRGI
ncbi:Sec9 protein [Pichia kluyveri]|uniref:Sec9 protein n=1 Tax=Pichia kluyveri TaxID=36015 RepID=A0AAV5R4B7_PICKL|nr:Sec9 protein [Pichia kluyveri]